MHCRQQSNGFIGPYQISVSTPRNRGLLMLNALSLLALFTTTPRISYAGQQSVLKAVTGDTNFPYNFVKDNRVQGLSVDLANEIARRLGTRLEIEVVPWTRALHIAQTQPAVMVFTVAKIPERDKLFYWVGPVANSEEWLYKLKRRTDIHVRNLHDARRYLVGDEASNASIPSFLQLGIKVDTAPSMLSNCKKFKVGRVDLIPFDPDGVAAFVNECNMRINEIEKTVRIPRDTALYFAFGKDTPFEFIQEVEKVFAAMRKDNTLSRINRQWKSETLTDKK
jgi:polar amino acid transport system substrate-binding protein